MAMLRPKPRRQAVQHLLVAQHEAWGGDSGRIEQYVRLTGSVTVCQQHRPCLAGCFKVPASLMVYLYGLHGFMEPCYQGLTTWAVWAQRDHAGLLLGLRWGSMCGAARGSSFCLCSSSSKGPLARALPLQQRFLEHLRSCWHLGHLAKAPPSHLNFCSELYKDCCIHNDSFRKVSSHQYELPPCSPCFPLKATVFYVFLLL